MPNGIWTWDRPDIAEAQKQQTSASHPNMAAVVRGVSPIISAEGGWGGALTAGAAEALAQFLEHSADKPYRWQRIAAEAGLGAVPFGKIVKAGKVGASAIRSGALSGAGEALREATSGEDLSAGNIVKATGIGAVTGGVGSKISGMMGLNKASEATENIPSGRLITVTGASAPKVPPPDPSILSNKMAGRTTTTWPAPLAKVTEKPANIQQASPSAKGLSLSREEQLGKGIVVETPAIKPYKTWAQAVGAAKKAGLPNSAVSKVEGGYTIKGAPLTTLNTRPNQGVAPSKATPSLPTMEDAMQTAPVKAARADMESKANALKGSFKAEAARVASEPTATFIGYQERLSGKPLALYNVVGGASDRSTVGASQLKKLGIGVPETPSFDEWAGKTSTTVKDTASDTSKRMASNMPKLSTKKSAPVEPVVKANKTIADIKERTGITAGNAPYNPEAGPAASPVSGAIQAYPTGNREGYLFGQHSPKTIIKAERAGDTVVTPEGTPKGGGFTLGSGLGGAQDIAGIIQRNPEFALRVGTTAAGAGIGAATADEDNRLQGALVGGAIGAAAPSLPKVLNILGVKAKGLQDLNLTSEAGLKETVDKVLHTIPQIQRFNYLASASGLPANAIVGPYGAALTGAIERALSGDPRGLKALQTLKNPVSFLEMYNSPWAAKEAERLLTEAATPERLEGTANKGIEAITSRLSLPGKLMTRGDVVARKVLSDAGFTEDETRLMTLTAEPMTKLFKSVAHSGQGSAVMQTLFPFRRTPANIAERGLERIPGIGFIAQMRRADKPADSLQQMLVQQALGAGAGGVGYGIGANTDPENAKQIRKYMTNLAGTYSLPMAVGLAAGQASQFGQSPYSEATLTGIRESLPLPSLQTVEDIVKYATGRSQTVPRSLVPQDLYDYLQER